MGRHVVEFVPGESAMPFTTRPGGDPVALADMGRIIRKLHDILASFEPPTGVQWNCEIPANGADLIIHNDLAPWNVVRSEERVVIIDWDGAAPGTRLWDLSYAAHGFIPLAAGAQPEQAGRDLRALADGYGLDADGRSALLALLIPRTLSMFDLLARGHTTGAMPWARLWDEGHGEVWYDDAKWIETHIPHLAESLDLPS